MKRLAAQGDGAFHAGSGFSDKPSVDAAPAVARHKSSFAPVALQHRKTSVRYEADPPVPFRLTLCDGELRLEGGPVCPTDPEKGVQHLRFGLMQFGTHVARSVLLDALRLLDDYEARK